jgi:hypothetical protein
MQEEEDEADNDQEDRDDDPEDTGTEANGGDNNDNAGENTAKKKNANAAKANAAKTNANEGQKPDFRNVKGWYNSQVAAVNAVTNELNTVMARCSTPEQWELISELEIDLLMEATRNLVKTADEFKTVACAGSFEEVEAERTKKARVRITKAPQPARRTSGQQPKA